MRTRRVLLLALAVGSLGASGDGPAGALAAQDAPGTRPALGAELAVLPAGAARAIADAHCLRCHSAEIVRQQSLNDKQWTAVLDKMVRWGAEVPEADRAALVAYLVQQFGPDNDRFAPVETQPAPVR